MSIISLPRQHLKPHPDQAAIPAEKPRGVDPRPLHTRPGVTRQVLDELRALNAEPTPAEQLRHAWTMTLAPLHDLLAEPEPVTDWAAIVRGIQARALRNLTRVSAGIRSEVTA